MLDRCPFCRSYDARAISDPALDLVGYRCHDCGRTFYLTSATPVPSVDAAAHLRRSADERDVLDRHPSRGPAPCGRPDGRKAETARSA